MDKSIDTMSRDVVQAIEDKKGVDALVIHVEGRCSVADRFVLASGRNGRQLVAMAQAVAEVAHTYGLPGRIEGREAAEWLLIDLGDVVVHLFLPEVRESFQLERLWALPPNSGEADAEQTNNEETDDKQ
ncbi:MAG: ribosome silencing factor [Mariprofundaceae bacterium]|nr:ribosome silencing factor [Mariprofundaceae bacterium]